VKITRVDLKHVTKHAHTTIDLPERGVVLVTGHNGSGKSSLVEGVPLALWGKTLRGAKLWSAKDGAVEIQADDLSVKRTANKRVKLSFRRSSDTDQPAYESTTEAQKGLDAALGISFGQWRRACVLSSSDADTFTRTTDAERKRLIEALTSGDRFEGAYQRAREDLRSAESGLGQMLAKVAVVEERVEGARQRLSDAVPPEGTPTTPPPKPDLLTLEQLRLHDQSAARDIRDQSRQINQIARSAGADALAKVQDARRQHRRLDTDQCPTCGQPISDALRGRLAKAVSIAETEAAKAEATAKAEVEDLEHDLAELQDERRCIQDRISALDAEVAAFESHSRELKYLARVDTIRREATKALATARTELTELTAEATHAKAELAVIEAAVKTLSTRGVRAHLLAKTIAAIEASANAWLDRICDGRLRLVLRPYGTKKDGGLKDAVSMEIKYESDSDDAKGYANASGGERRRVDIAITIALAEVAEAALGRQGSTIFCDEIFDALDGEGVSRVCGVLADLGRDRCVVVIAHSAADQLQAVADRHLRLRDGVVSPL
jgi:DNA repair exonuclease SbcCD ATPase subunit